MGHSQDFLVNLAIVLCVAAATTVLFARLRLPTVFGYIAAGLIIGPNVPIPLVADQTMVHTLAALGVILLMFCLGLEFSLRRLWTIGPTAAFIAAFEVNLMIWLGYLMARSLGWSSRTAVFTGAIVAFSSTTIVARALEAGNKDQRFAELIVGMLVFEDLIAIASMTLLTAFGPRGDLSLALLGGTLGPLSLFLLGFLLVGLIVIPPCLRVVRRLGSPETTLVACMGCCFLAASAAVKQGYSGALGAFLAGSLIAQAGGDERLSDLVRPVRDMFVAVFFVAVGMMIVPADALVHWRAIAALCAVVLVGKVVAVGIAALLAGRGLRLSLKAGMTLAQIGEFSFILAEVGGQSGATPSFLYPIAIAVSAITTLLTHALARAAEPLARALERYLPQTLRTFLPLYESWVESLLRTAPARVTNLRLRRRLFILFADVALLAALLIGASAWQVEVVAFVERLLAVGEKVARTLGVALTAAAALPLCVGLARSIRKTALLLSTEVLPMALSGNVDLAATPRRAFIMALQLALLLLVGAPFVAVTQPFVGTTAEVFAVSGVLLVLGVMFWRQAHDLQGHVRAGAEVLIEVLSGPQVHPTPPRESGASPMAQALAGLGQPVSVRLPVGSVGVGRTLAEIDLRGTTGATVLAILRDGAPVHLPAGTQRLVAGDVLALVGSTESVQKAVQVLGAATTGKSG